MFYLVDGLLLRGARACSLWVQFSAWLDALLALKLAAFEEVDIIG